jgi:hypothetical protein
VLGFEQNVALEDAICFHTSSLEASVRVINDIPFGCPYSYRLMLYMSSKHERQNGGLPVASLSLSLLAFCMIYDVGENTCWV